jgi:chromosome segregation ATPase
LDELNAHRFLEGIQETHTVISLREALRATGAISASDRPKTVPITHYLLFRFKVNWRQLVNTKGDNSAEIAEAQRLLDEVCKAFAESEKQAHIARVAENEARVQEAPFKAAQEELEAAVADVKRQEDQKANKTADLTRKSSEGSVVQQSKAKAELAQHLAEDPLPLRKAKITLEAARKKAEKARAPFEAATKLAEAARAKAEAALEDAQNRVAEAEAYLNEVKAKPGSPHGAIWWIERELQEQKKYVFSSHLLFSPSLLLLTISSCSFP